MASITATWQLTGLPAGYYLVQATTAAVQAGFSQLYAIANYTNQLLLYQIQQNDTMVCYLEKITRQTCALLNEAALQTAAQQAMRADLDELTELYELANPAAAVGNPQRVPQPKASAMRLKSVCDWPIDSVALGGTAGPYFDGGVGSCSLSDAGATSRIVMPTIFT